MSSKSRRCLYPSLPTKPIEQVIVTVALVAPRRGVLKDAVKHLLAVSTTQEVALLAVTYPDGSGSGRTGRIEVCVFREKSESMLTFRAS